MRPFCVYIFDSSTANEAALAVGEGQCGSIIQYHNLKHQERENKLKRLGRLANLTTPSPVPAASSSLQVSTSNSNLYTPQEQQLPIQLQLQHQASPLGQPAISPVVPQVARKLQDQLLDMKTSSTVSQDWLDNICRHLIDHMNRFGICVIDNFLGSTKGDSILSEVIDLFSSGQYSKGKLVSDKLTSSVIGNGSSGIIRSDRVIWIDGCENGCAEINNLIQTLCSVVTNSSRLALYSNKGLDKVVINKRTKAHVACYPGNGTRYIKHVDNPNGDGRVITSIYYINKEWNTKRDGGLLRMFPAGMNEIANIEPLFDRALFFWSDRRNPHEVLPAFRDRFAITVWYIGEDRA